jgi:hypothetical protein
LANLLDDVRTFVSIGAKEQKLYETARNIAHRCANANLFSVTSAAQMPFFIGSRASRSGIRAADGVVRVDAASQLCASTQQNQ